MKNFVFVLVMLLAMSGVAVASNDVEQSTMFGNNYNATANGNGVNNWGTIGGNSTIEKGAITNTNTNENKNTNMNTNFNTNINSNKAEANNENVNVNIVDIKGPKQGQLQGQMQGQMQVNEGNKVEINNERPLLGYSTGSASEVHFGAGKVEWYYGRVLPKIAIPLYDTKEIVKEVVNITANVPIKRLLPTLLKMQKKEMPLCYNVRLIIVKAEAQKTWTTGGAVSGGSAGNFAQGGASAGASVLPSIGGTKAHDLYTIMIVKVQ